MEYGLDGGEYAGSFGYQRGFLAACIKVLLSAKCRLNDNNNAITIMLKRKILILLIMIFLENSGKNKKAYL